jgi:putative ABC transport system permease protein
MFQIAIRGLKQNPFRYVATAIAIVLGVAFFVATSVMTTSFEDTLNGSIAEAFDDVDGAVRSTEVIDTGFSEIRQKIPYETGEQVAAIAGVERAGAFLSGYAQAVTADGDVVDSAGQPPQGFAWLDDTELSPYAIVDGAAPVTADEIALDENTFVDGDFAIGDQVRVLPLPADQAFTVVGVVGPNGDGDAFSGQTVAFSLDGAAQAFGSTDVDQIFVQGDDGFSQTELAATINDALSASGTDGLEAITGDELVGEYEETIGQVTAIINVALQVFAAIALVVGAFVIYNTFSITVAQRRRDMALLRAIGASTKQVTRSVIVESLLIGAIASAVGALVGVGLGWVLLQGLGALGAGFDIALTVPLATVVAGIAIGTITTFFAAYVPARRGASIAPIEALRESSIEQPATSKWRTASGVVLLAIGVTMSISAVTAADLAALGVGLPATVLAMVLLGPAIIRPMSTLIAIPMVRNGSITGELARENAARNPKRTSTTSLTLVIGVALVVTATVFAATMSASTRGQLEEQIVADHVVTVGPEISLLGGGLDPTITPSIGELADVDAAVPFRQAFVEILDGFDQLTGTDTTQLGAVLDLDIIDGNVTGLAGDQIAVSEARADDDNLTVGDAVEVRFQQQAVTLQVAGVYERDAFVGSWLVDNSVLEANTSSSLDTEVLIRSSDGNGDSVVTAVTAVLASNPTADIDTTASFIDGEVGQIDQLLTLLYGLLAMSVFVALIGIVNTMALSIHERTRELGLLRAVGMSSRQLRRTIRYESTIIALIGTVVGLALGLFLGWVASRAAQDTFPDFAIPTTSLIVIAVVGIIAGLAAGVLPARRAGRLDVLDAIAGE